MRFCNSESFFSVSSSSLWTILNEQVYQYLGKNLNFENINKHRNYNKLKFKKSTIFYDNGIKIKKTSNENTLDIYQNTPG